MTSQVLRSGSDRHLRLIDLDTDLAPFRKWVEIGTTLDQALREFFSPGLEGVSTDGERTLRFVGLEELYQLCRVEEVQKMIDELVIVTIVTMQQAPQLLNIKLPWFTFTQPTDVHKDVDGLLDLEIDDTDIYWFIIRLALIFEWRSIAVHVLIVFLCVLDIVLVFLGSFLEFLVDLLIILLTVLLFLELLLVLLVFLLERLSLDLRFFFRLLLFNWFLFNLLRFLRCHFLLCLLSILSLFLLLELILDLDLNLFFFLTLHVLLKGQSSKGILPLCSFCLIDDLEERLPCWFGSQHCLARLGVAICNLLMFCRLGVWLCLGVSIELAHL